jgi:DNA-binding transcriptional regulator GbsR (MarR family)
LKEENINIKDDKTTSDVMIEKELLAFLPEFENFFNRVGFKRIDGAVFGLLSFAKDPLTSEQIEKVLGLSQSAVSNSLKTLHEYSMIISADCRETKRLKLHSAKEDGLAIVASVLRKREMHVLQEFEKMTQKASQIVDDEKRKARIETMTLTARFAKSLSQVIIKISDEFENPYPVMARIPQTIDFLKKSVPTIGNAKDQLTSTIKNKLGNWLATVDTQGEKNESI